MPSQHTQNIINNLYNLSTKMQRKYSILKRWILPTLSLFGSAWAFQRGAQIVVDGTNIASYVVQTKGYATMIVSAGMLLSSAFCVDYQSPNRVTKLIKFIFLKLGIDYHSLTKLSILYFTKIVSDALEMIKLSTLHRHQPNTINELHALTMSFHDFFKQIHARFHPRQEADQVAFLQFLKAGAKINQLLTLVKLGASKEDCHIETFEEADARSQTRGSNSLLWLAAKAVNKHAIKLPQNTPQEIQEVVKASKKYSF